MKHFQLEILVSLAPIHKKISRSLACKANMFMLDAHMDQRPPLMALLLRIPLGLDAYRDIGLWAVRPRHFGRTQGLSASSSSLL